MDNDTFWGRAKPLIKAHSMTQKQFADYLGFSHHTIRNWIYNKRVPDLSAANAIAFALGVSLEYLLSGQEKDIAVLRLREIESRKAAGRLLKMMEKMQEQLRLMRPLAEHWARETKSLHIKTFSK